MIHRDKARSIVASFSALPFYRTMTPEGKAELITAVEACEDIDHADRLKADVLTFDAVPSPK